jgi:hypothetical protein
MLALSASDVGLRHAQARRSKPLSQTVVMAKQGMDRRRTAMVGGSTTCGTSGNGSSAYRGIGCCHWLGRGIGQSTTLTAGAWIQARPERYMA